MTKVKQSFIFAIADTDKLVRFDENGIIRIIFMTLPAFEDNPVVTLTMQDDEGNTIWTDAGAPRADGASYLIDGLAIPVDYGFKFNMHISDAGEAAGGTATVKSFIETVK